MSLLRKWGFGVAAVLLAFVVVVLSYLRIHPSGTAALPAAGTMETSAQALDPFDNLVIDGPFAVTLTAGAPGLTLTAEAAVPGSFVADLRGGVLRLYLKDPVEIGETPRLAITAAGLASVELTGTARLEAAGGLGPGIRIVANDAATAVLRGDCERAVLVAGGAADIDARGLRCRAIEATAAGSAKIHESGL